MKWTIKRDLFAYCMMAIIIAAVVYYFPIYPRAFLIILTSTGNLTITLPEICLL